MCSTASAPSRRPCGSRLSLPSPDAAARLAAADRRAPAWQFRRRGDGLMSRDLAAASLFSGAGIGDVGFRAAGMDVLALCEVEPDRAALAALNFPEAHVEVSDVWQAGDRFVEVVSDRLRQRGDELFLLSCTAPCQ